MLDCQSKRGWGTDPCPEIQVEISTSPALLANSAVMSTLSVPLQQEEKMAGEGTGHPPSYAEVKKMKLLAIYTHGCLQGYLKGLLFLSLINCLNCQFYVWPGTNMKGILSRRKWGH